MKKSFIGVILLSVMLVFFSNPAMAAQAVAKAELDWSNLQFNGLSLSAQTFFTFSTQTTSTWTDAVNSIPENSPNYPADTSNWTAAITTTSSVTQGKGLAVASTTKLGSYTSAGPTGSVDPESWANSYRYGVFTYSGTAPLTVTVTIPYHIKYVLNASAANDNYAYGYAEVYYQLTRDKKGILPGQASGGDQYASDLALTGQIVTTNPANENGTLTFQLTFYKGNSGTITLGTYANTSASAVPVPAAFWLLGSGLVGLIGIRRKTRA